MKIKNLALVLAAVGAFSSAPAHGEPVVLKLSHQHPQQRLEFPSAAMAAVLKSETEANSNGRIKVEVFPNGVLGKEQEILAQVKAGIVQSHISTAAGIAQAYPLIEVVDAPFAFSGYGAGYRVYDGAFGKALARDVERKTGLKVLGFGDSGDTLVLTNSRRPVRLPADVKGLKLRAPSQPLLMETLKALGASSSSVAPSDLAASLKSGALDGRLDSAAASGSAENQKYATVVGILGSPCVWVLNADFYSRLDPELQAVVSEAVRTAILAGRGLSRLLDSGDKGRASLASKVELFVPGPAESKRFRAAALPAVRRYLSAKHKKDGELWLDQFYAAADAAEKESSK